MTTKYEINGSGDEMFGGDDSAVIASLRSLDRVKAPANFEFGVKARIARSAAARHSLSSYLRPFAYASPVVLLLVIASVFLFRQPGGSGEANIATAPNAVSSPQLAVEVKPEPTVSFGEPERAGVATEPPLTPASSRVQRARVSNTNAPATGTSFDVSASPANTVLPRGFDAKPVIKRDKTMMSASVDVGQALKVIGIDAKFSDGVWSITSIAADSISERSGLKSGDIVDSLDDRKISGVEELKGRVEMKRITVVRDGSQKVITLGQKQ